MGLLLHIADDASRAFQWQSHGPMGLLSSKVCRTEHLTEYVVLNVEPVQKSEAPSAPLCM